MNEIDKEMRLALIESWKGALMLCRRDIETTNLDYESTKARLLMLESREALINARINVIRLYLSQLGVKNP